MCNTRDGMYEYKPCKAVNVCTASLQKLPASDIVNIFLGVQQKTPAGLILDEVLHVPKRRENMFSPYD